MFAFWSTLAVIGAKIRGFYLSYMVFWFLFFVPAILHYNLPRKLLNKALPFLEQLDHSMKYQRRSVLDRSELLVDVKLPSSDQNADLEEDEYINSFKMDDIEHMGRKERRALENLEDDDDYDESEEQAGPDDEEEEDDEEDSYFPKKSIQPSHLKKNENGENMLRK